MGSKGPEPKKVIHKIPLLSLDKAMNFNELSEWISKLVKQGYSDFIIEPKHDGLACKLLYKNGKFIQGSTRGNGYEGSDVTIVCKQIPDIPKQLDSTILNDNFKKEIEVRGEIFLTKPGLDKINKYIIQYCPKETIKKNVRNTASGLLRDENPNPNKSKYLTFSAYMLPNSFLKSHSESMKYLSLLGFKVTNDFVPNYKITITSATLKNDLAKISTLFNKLANERSNLEFDIDGMVIKIDKYSEQNKLSNKRNVPNWAIAYKFPSEEKVSILRDVSWELGPKGNITPVAIIDPVTIFGAEITNPTLHNIEEVKRLGIKIGDHCVITRRGDVIPKIIKVLPELRDGTEIDISIPEKCPVCGGLITKNDVFIRCDSPTCKGRITGKIIDYINKLDIKDFGEKLITKLVNIGKLTNQMDIYRLVESDISVLDKQGDVSATKIISRINDAKKASLAKIIAGFGIPGIGDVTGAQLASYYQSLTNFKNAKFDELVNMKDIGETTAISIINWIKDNINLIDDAISLNLGINQNKDGKLLNKVFAFTGTLSISRKKLQEIIEQNGGSSSSIRNGINYLVIGEGAKKAKIEKAERYNVQIITEKEFNQLLI